MVLRAHILKCIDSGWCFVYQKGEAEQVFRLAREQLAGFSKMNDDGARISSMRESLKQIVDAGWDHINTIGSSENVKHIFSEARQCVSDAQIARKIQPMFVVLFSNSDDEERMYTFNDPITERQFQIRRTFNSENVREYFMWEMTPNGRLVEVNEKGLATKGWDDPRISDLEVKVGPNGVIAKCRELGIDPEAMVLIGAGYSVNSKYHSSMESCALAIASSLSGNVRYNAYRELSHEEVASLEQRQKVSSSNYWIEQESSAKAAEIGGVGIFKGCYTMMGGPISEEYQKRILGYLNSPSQDEWNDIRGYLITARTTLWQSWCASDDTAPRSGDKGFPSPELLRTAIRQSVKLNLEHIEEKKSENTLGMLRLCKETTKSEVMKKSGISKPKM